MQITLVERDSKNKDRYLVYIDDKLEFSISEDDYLRLGFYEKKDISEEEINIVKNDINLKSAKISAVRFLSFKFRTENEIREKLKDQGFEDNIIDLVIIDLKASGYINDLLYAEKYINDRIKLKPSSKKLIQYELEHRGISSADVNAALENVEMDDYAIAEALISKKFSNYNFEDEKTIRKVISFLQRRCYDYEIINGIIKKLKQETNENI